MPYTQNPFNSLLPDLTPKPPMIPTEVVKGENATEEVIRMIKKAGITAEMVQRSINADIEISWDRWNIYQEVERAITHWMVGPAIELYAGTSTPFSPIHGATCWVQADSETYQRELNDLFDRISIEERIHDWAFTLAAYGDLFIELNGMPGLGIVSINDAEHPMNTSRVEYEGILVGFYKSLQGFSGNQSTEKNTLIPPWKYVHMRLLGGIKRRSRFAENQYSEMRSVNLITTSETRQVTTRYGTSLLLNALPSYKRLRLAEDSLLLARVTRGIIKYIWKYKVDGTNMEAVSSLMDQYATLITRARAIDTREGSASFDSKNSSISAIEDIFIPVWGDINDLTYEKVGGEADIRWIVDIDNLRNQLATALATPPSLLGGYVKEATGSLGSEAIEQLGIRFARSARRIQRALINGLVRMCQIHLAYKGMDPDPQLFQIQMAETSTAEENAIRKGLETGLKTLGSFMSTLKKVSGRKLDPEKVFEYYNDKILRLEDFRIEDFYKSKDVIAKEAEAAAAKAAAEAMPPMEQPGAVPPAGGPVPAVPPVKKEEEKKPIRLISSVEDDFDATTIIEAKVRRCPRLNEGRFNTDVYACLPAVMSSHVTEDTKDKLNERIMIIDNPAENPIDINFLEQRDYLTWMDKYGDACVTEIAEEKKV